MADPERIIAAVRERPCIWDVCAGDYHDRGRTREAWGQVCAEVSPWFEVMPEGERNALMISVMKKWRNMRDSYVKDLKAWKYSGSKKPMKRRKYIFYDKLSFLGKSVEAKLQRMQACSDIDWSDSEEDWSQMSSHEGDFIDPYRLIAAVEGSPPIWDTLSADYHDRNKTRLCWVSICQGFYPQYDELSDPEKANIMTNIQKKWRNFRDCFVKDLKAAKRCGNARPLKRRKYIFFDRLAFLTRSVETKIGASMSAGSPGDPTDEDTQEKKYRPPEELDVGDFCQPAKEEEQVDEKLYPICDLLDNARSTRSSSPERQWTVDPLQQTFLADDDLAFFISLLPAVRRFNEDTKFEFRMEVMKLLQKLRVEQKHSEQASQQKPSTST